MCKYFSFQLTPRESKIVEKIVNNKESIDNSIYRKVDDGKVLSRIVIKKSEAMTICNILIDYLNNTDNTVVEEILLRRFINDIKTKIEVNGDLDKIY